MKKIAFLSLFFLISSICVAFADMDGKFVETKHEYSNYCLDSKIMVYRTEDEGGGIIWKAIIFEKLCNSQCWEQVYDGPMGSYSGPYEDDLAKEGLPFSIGSGGNGFVSVPLGGGGYFGPSTNPSCDAAFTPDYSSTIVISAAFLSGIVLQ